MGYTYTLYPIHIGNQVWKLHLVALLKIVDITFENSVSLRGSQIRIASQDVAATRGLAATNPC